MSDSRSSAGSTHRVRASAPVPQQDTRKRSHLLDQDEDGVYRDIRPISNRPPKKVKDKPPLPDWVIGGKPTKIGPRKVLWHLYVALRLYKLAWVPQPRPHGLHLARVRTIMKWVVDNRHLSMAIVAVVTTKGGATKSTVSTWFAALLEWITKLQAVVFDADTGGGKSAKRFGIDPNTTFESHEAIKLIVDEHWDPTYEDLVGCLQSDRETGVMVFYCAAGKRGVTSDNAVKALISLKRTAHTLVVDTAPGFERSITEGVVEAATVSLIVGNHHSSEDMDDIGKTLAHEAYGYGSKLDQVVIVISSVRWQDFNTRTQYSYAERFHVRPDQVVLIPYIRHLHKVTDVRSWHHVRRLFGVLDHRSIF